MHVDGFTTFLMTVFLSMGGSWYLQNNLSGDLKAQLVDHAKELFELRTKVNTQAAEIKQLREDIKEQNKQITDQDKLITELKLQIILFEKFKVRILIALTSYIIIYVAVAIVIVHLQTIAPLRFYIFDTSYSLFLNSLLRYCTHLYL